MDVLILRHVLEGLLQAARNHHPREFFCLLGGEMHKEYVLIDEIIFIPFRSSPASAVFRLDDIPINDRVVGSAHSHPFPSPPSHADLRTFPHAGWVHLLLLPPYREENVRAYDARGNPLSIKVIGQRASF